MTVTLARVEMARTNGLPEDTVVNTFVFDNPLLEPAAHVAQIDGALGPFYNANAAGAGDARICDFISSVVSRVAGATQVKYYDISDHLDGTPAGSPIAVANMAILNPALGANDLPSEVAAVISFHATLTGIPENVPGGVAGPAGDTKPKARRRGRTFIGPLRDAALAPAPLAGDVRLAADFQETLVDAAVALMNHDAGLSVWSRTDGQVRRVTGGWVDNTFDTQRRRGADRTQRTVFGTAP